MNLAPVSITQKALMEIKSIISNKNIPADYGLRVGISGGGGCGGVSFVLGFDKKNESDLEYAVEDVVVYVDKKHAMYLLGKQVDFYEGSDARGFVFTDTVREQKSEGQRGE